MNGPVIALAADHAGFELKNGMKAVLDEHSFSLIDLGPETADPVDYPDMTGKLAAVLKDGRAQEGLLVCGTGIGIAIAANRFPAYGPPCVTTSPRRVWRARTMVLTSSRLARA